MLGNTGIDIEKITEFNGIFEIPRRYFGPSEILSPGPLISPGLEALPRKASEIPEILEVFSVILRGRGNMYFLIASPTAPEILRRYPGDTGDIIKISPTLEAACFLVFGDPEVSEIF